MSEQYIEGMRDSDKLAASTTGLAQVGRLKQRRAKIAT
jgi:hypothetical protein